MFPTKYGILRRGYKGMFSLPVKHKPGNAFSCVSRCLVVCNRSTSTPTVITFTSHADQVTAPFFPCLHGCRFPRLSG
jgi:hypothetical protein